jgi:hypothetical protein
MTAQTPETPAAPRPGSPEYDEAMAAKFRASKEPDPAPADPAAAALAEPDPALAGVPPKFVKDGVVDVAALLASYAALEKRLGSGGAPAPAASPAASTPAPGAPLAVPADQPAGADPAAAEGAARATVQNAGLDWNVLAGKATKGEAFTDAEYAALEASGMPRAVADTVAQSLAKTAADERAAAITYAGGEGTANALLAWAATNLTPAERETYNSLLASPNWRVAIDSLKARAATALPTLMEPKLQAGGNEAGKPVGFRSRAEMTAAMSDPRYRKDPAFREQVASRMRFATWDLDR